MDFNKHFEIIKFMTKFAGIISVIQSTIWIGFSICGIISYFCFLNFENVNLTLGTITRLTFFELYFNSGCNSINFPNNATHYFDLLKRKELLHSDGIFYGMCIYLGLSVLWLMNSIPLITLIHEKHLRRSNILLYSWILITLAVCVVDIGSGIVFGLDYNQFAKISKTVDLNYKSLYPVIILSAMRSAIVMLVMSLRGFILWVLNAFFLIYLFSKTFAINGAISSNAKRIKEDSVSDTHSILRRHPLRAFETHVPGNTQYPVEINTEPLKRAYQMSLESLKERQGGFSNPNFNRLNEYSMKNEFTIPDPDYTPPASRAFRNNIRNQQVLKNKRFQ